MWPDRTPWWSIGAAMKAVRVTGGAELPEADRRGELLQAPHPQRSRQGVQVLEELLTLRGLPQPLHIAGVEAQDQVVLHLVRIVQGNDRGEGRVGQGAGAVHHGLQRRVHVQTLVDVETGLAETGEAVSGGFDSLVPLNVILQLFTSWGLKPWEVGAEQDLFGSTLANWAKRHHYVIEIANDFTHK